MFMKLNEDHNKRTRVIVKNKYCNIQLDNVLHNASTELTFWIWNRFDLSVTNIYNMYVLSQCKS